MSAERRIDPDYVEPESGHLRRIIREELRAREPVEVYNEASKQPDLTTLCRVLTWVAVVVAPLAVAGIIGVVVMYGRVSSLETKVDMLISLQQGKTK